MFDGQAQQVAVSDLSVAEYLFPVEVTLVKQAVVVRNEGVPGVRQGLGKTLCNGLQWKGLWVRRLRHDAQAAVLREWARDPSVVNFLFKPLLRTLVVNVPGVEQGNQHIHIQKGTHQIPSASRRRLIRSLVTITPLEGKGSNPVVEGFGWAFAAMPVLPVSACLNNSETTLPTPTCFCRAISLAALRTSISISSVVRMLCSMMHHQCIMMIAHQSDDDIVKKPSDKEYIWPLWGQVY